MMNEKDKMHPEDMRNLVIFMVISVFLWFAYEAYIMKPQRQAMQKAQIAKAEIMLKDPQLLEPQKPMARAEALLQSPRVKFDSGEIFGSIALTGGRIDDVRFHHYFKKLDRVEPVELLSPAKTEQARYVDYGWVAQDQKIKLPDAQTLWQVMDGAADIAPEKPITLFWENGHGLRFEREITIDKNFVFSITQRVINNSGADVRLHPYGLISQTGVPKDFQGSWIAHEGPMGFIDNKLFQRSYSALLNETETLVDATQGWIGVSDKYWLTALMPEQGKPAKYRFLVTKHPTKHEYHRYQTDFTGDAVNIPQGGQAQSQYKLYAGAKKVLLLEEYQQKLGVKNLDLAVDFGWFWFLTYPFFLALHYLNLWVGNMGVAIVLLTIVIRTLAYPLMNFSYRSFAKLKKVQPQVVEIRRKHENDKQALQAAMVELYQKEGVNPVSGCLPMLIQIPVFFAFYKNLLITIELRHAPFFGWIKDLSDKDPTSIFNLFGLLPYEVPSFLVVGVLPCVWMVAQLIQKELNPPPQDHVMRIMMRYFPYYVTFLMSSLASGLFVYWVVGAYIGIIQQMLMMRSLGVPIYIFNKEHYKKEQEMEALIAKGPDVHPLAQMAEDEVEKALFGAEDAPSNVVDMKPPKPKKKKKKK